MSKVLGFALAAVTLVMAIACGGSDSASTATQYKISGETPAVTDATQYKVGAFTSDTTATPVADSSLTTSAGNLSYAINLGASAGSYTVKMYKFTAATGNPVLDSSGNVLSVYTDYRTATVDGISDRQKAGPAYQMNAFTTLLSKKIAAGNTATQALESIFPGANVSLASLTFVDGGVYVGGQPKSMDAVAKSALTQISYVSAMVDALTVSTAATSVGVDFTALVKSYASSANIDDISTAAAGLSTITTALGTALSDAAFSLALKNVSPVLATKVTTLTAIPTTAAAIATQYAQIASIELASISTAVDILALVNAALLNVIATAVDVSATVTAAVAEAVAPVTPTAFRIVNGGVAATDGFSLTSTSPIFAVDFGTTSVVKDVTSEMTLTVNGSDLTSTGTSSSVAVWNTARTTLYLLVRNDSAAAMTLTPGQTFSYALTSASSNVVLTSLTNAAGNMTSSNITFSDAYAGLGDNPVVAISGTEYTGTTASALSFVVDSKSAITVDTAANDYGLVSSLTYTLGGTTGSLNYNASDIVVTATPSASKTITTATVSLGTAAQASLTSGSYVVSPTLSANVTGAPTTLSVTIK